MQDSARRGPALSRLLDRMAGLRDRARRLTALQAVAATAAVAAGGAAWMLLAPGLRLQRAEALAVLVLWVGVGAWRAWLPWWTADAAATLADPARRVEAVQPALGGRLLTVVERPDGPRVGESAEVLDWLAFQAAPLVDQVADEDAYTGTPARRWAQGASAAWAVVLVLALMAPDGWAGVSAYWGGAAVAAETLANQDVQTFDELAKVGDITLRYTYPEYMGREPYEVVNSTGEVAAPPGTVVEVSARSADVVASAGLVLGDDPALEATVTDGRQIAARFVVGKEATTYTLLSTVGDEVKRSRAFPVVPEPDLAPVVVLSGATKTLEIDADAQLPLAWNARDDHGLRRVVLKIDRIRRDPPLREPRERVADLSGVLNARPMDLGMEAGSTYLLVVGAWDNDTVSGSKEGTSAELEIVVHDANGQSKLDDATLVALLNALLDPLADFLEEPWPAARTEDGIARWGERVGGRYEPMFALFDELGASRRKGLTWSALGVAANAARDLVRYTQVAFPLGSRTRADEQSLQRLTESRDEAIVTLEEAAILIDRIRRMQALDEVLEEVEVLAFQADLLRAAGATSPLDALTVRLEAEATDTQLDRLLDAAGRLGEGGLQQIVVGRGGEAELQLDALDGALDDEVASVPARTKGLANTLDQLAASVREEMMRREEAQKEQESKGKSVIEELKAIAEAQEAQTEQLANVRAEGERRIGEALSGLWARLEAAAKRLEDVSADLYADTEKAKHPYDELRLVRSVQETGNDVSRAVGARDLSGAQQSAFDASTYWDIYGRRAQMRYADRFTNGPMRSEAVATDRALSALLDLLDQTVATADQEDPEVRNGVRPFEGNQRRLQQRLAKAEVEARQLAQELPVTPRGMEQHLETAGERMGDALKQLARGQALQAQGSSAAASVEIRDAIEALQDAMAASAASSAQGQGDQASGSGPGGEEEADGGGAEEGDQQQRQPMSIELPEPEEFRTPEAYREALLRGMEADVPEEYRSLKKRYFEELVHQ